MKSAQLSWSSGPIRGVAPAFSTRTSGRTSARMRWAASVVGDVDRDHCDAEPLLHRCERGLAARHDGGPGLGCRRSPRWYPSALLCLVPAEPRTFGAAEKSNRGPRGTAIAAGEARFEPVLVCRLGRTFERKAGGTCRGFRAPWALKIGANLPPGPIPMLPNSNTAFLASRAEPRLTPRMQAAFSSSPRA